MADRMNFKGVRLRDKLLLSYIKKVPDHLSKLRIVNVINDVFFSNTVQIKGENNSTFYVSTREQTGMGLIKEDNYEPLTLKLCADILKDGGTMVDVGANMGIFSIYLSKIAGVDIYAIEPSAANFQMLMRHIKVNKTKNVMPLNIGLSHEDSFGYITNLMPQNAGTMKVVEAAGDDSYLIRLCRLADLLKEINVKKIDLLKMDVEGYEMNILKGLFIGNDPVKPKNIVLEFTDQIERTGHSLEESMKYMNDLGYSAFNMEGDPYVWHMPESNLLFRLDH